MATTAKQRTQLQRRVHTVASSVCNSLPRPTVVCCHSLTACSWHTHQWYSSSTCSGSNKHSPVRRAGHDSTGLVLHSRHGASHLRPAAAAVQAGSAMSSTNGTPQSSNCPTPILQVRDMCFHPPGVPEPLLTDINMDVFPNSLGLIIGRSGSGKTTLLQILAGLCDQTSGSVYVSNHNPASLSSYLSAASSSNCKSSAPSTSGNGAQRGAKFAARVAAEGRGSKFAARMASENRPVRSVSPPAPTPTPTSTPTAAVQQSPKGGSVGALLAAAAAISSEPASMEERMQRVGLVFQFPERHFLGSDVFNELTFSWPRHPEFFLEQHALRARVLQVLQAVRLADIDLRLSPRDLSGGQQRRLALAIQLIRQPAVLLLDEPLAGLDWQARQEVVELLRRLKQECSLIVVSHDLAEVSPLVDRAWMMKVGGTLEQLPSWPPANGNAAVEQ